MTRFNQVKYNAEASTAEVGSGMIWDDVYEQLLAYNVSVIGARAPGIGVGGFIVAGGGMSLKFYPWPRFIITITGYSYKTNQYGLAADNVVSMEVVLPTGQIKIISHSSHKDLFFALRGGGNNFVLFFPLEYAPNA
jgi:FAD/FMN-containing dehydrogenase